MCQVTESINPHVGEYFLYEGKYHIPEGFSLEIKDNIISVRQGQKFKVKDYVHSLYEDFFGNTKIVLGQVKEIFAGYYMLEGYCERGTMTFRPEQIVVHGITTKLAEDWEIELYNNSIEEYKTNYKDLIKKLCIK